MQATKPGSPFSNEYEPPKRGLGPFMLVVVLAGILVGAFFLLGLVPRLANNQELKRMHEETAGAVPVVHTVVARAAPFTETGILPGNVSAIQYASIYARVDGYLSKRFVDIGDHVKTGQMLAQIDTPTIDEELAQAQADYLEAKAGLLRAQSSLKEAIAKDIAAKAEIERARANETYAQVTASRWTNMATRGAVSIQSRDEKVRAYSAETADVKAAIAEEKAAQATVEAANSQVRVATATVAAKLASVRRFKAQQSFKYVLAPFDGVITLRKVDPGALITSGSQTSSLELFQMAKINTLRIYVNVPQTIARYIRAGQLAEVFVPEFPERIFTGRITNVAGALDPNTRTRQTEVRIDNRDHALLPGMYAQVKITALRDDPWMRIPGTCLVPRQNGMYAVIVNDKKVHYQQVGIGRDFGDEIEIKSGLHNNDVVVVSPAIDLREGEPINPQPVKAD